MNCWDCPHFKILYEPIGKISTGIWDFGRAKCNKHELVVDFPDHRKLKKLECVEKFDEKQPIVKKGAKAMDEEKTAEVGIEGDYSSWWYVCEECHTAINPKHLQCPVCKRRLNWNMEREVTSYDTDKYGNAKELR